MQSKVRSNKPVPLRIQVRIINHKYSAQNRTQVSKARTKLCTSNDITGSWVLFDEGCTYVITQKMSSKFPKI